MESNSYTISPMKSSQIKRLKGKKIYEEYFVIFALNWTKDVQWDSNQGNKEEEKVTYIRLYQLYPGLYLFYEWKRYP